MTCPRCGEQTNGRFCEGCGATLEQQPSVVVAEPLGDLPVPDTFIAMPHDEPPLTLAADPSVISKLRGLKQGPAVGLIVAAAIVLAVIGAALTSRETASKTASDTVAGQSATPAATPVATPHEICVLQLNAIMANFNDPRYEFLQVPINGEASINGYTDPFFRSALGINGNIKYYESASGNQAGLEDARRQPETICSTTLHDQIRPNYPTDGTHPDVSSASP